MPESDPRAVKRVVDRVPAPRICHHCGSPVKLANNSTIYGREFGDWPWVYLCCNRTCGAYVGMHPKTDIPLGTLADAQTREARKRAKAEFNPLWESKRLDRGQAYSRLAAKMGIPVTECHFGWFTVHQCREATLAAREIHQELRHCRSHE